jgi:surface antigen
MKKIQLSLILATLTLSAGQAFASNLKWLEYSPTSHFTEQDWDMAKSTAKNLMDSGKTGETASWNNAETGNGGSFTITGTTNRDNSPCVTLEIANHAKGMSGKGSYDFCKQPDGSWKSPQGKL